MNAFRSSVLFGSPFAASRPSERFFFLFFSFSFHLSEDFKLAIQVEFDKSHRVRPPHILIDLSYFNCRNLQFAKRQHKARLATKRFTLPRRLQNALLCRYNSFAHNAQRNENNKHCGSLGCVYFMRKLISLTSYLKNVFKHSLSPKKSQHCAAAAFCCCSRARLYIYSRAVMINCG
jgi:hypothetical protein